MSPDVSDGVGAGGHVVRAAGEDDVRVADEDLLDGVDDRLEARAAQPVHRQRRDLRVQAASQGRVSA